MVLRSAYRQGIVKDKYRAESPMIDIRDGIQLEIGTSMEDRDRLPTAKTAEFSDPAFATNKAQPVHRWVPWVAGFSRDFVLSALNRHLHKPGVVLDPFAGVGTTLIEANLAGHETIGFEINPYAAFACRTKLNARGVAPNCLKREIKDFLEFHSAAIKSKRRPDTQAPEGFHTRGVFYSPKVLHKVLLVHDFIVGINSPMIADMFRLAFASTMVTYSNYSYEPSLGRKAAAGRPDVVDYPVALEIAGKLCEMEEDIRFLRCHPGEKIPQATVFNKSFFDSHNLLSARSVNLLITSPPYLNNYHYNRNTRPHLFWLGFMHSPKDLKPLEEQNFGKFWQTVREDEHIGLDFPIKDSEISRCLKTLRGKNSGRGIYGGNGWANYAASYFNDCYRFSKAAKLALRRRGTALVVIGNSILQGVMIPTDRFLAKIAEFAGLEVVDIHIPRATRVGNSIIQSKVRVAKAGKGQQLYEAVVELRKR